MDTILFGFSYLVDALGLRPILSGFFALLAAIYFLFRFFDR